MRNPYPSAALFLFRTFRFSIAMASLLFGALLLNGCSPDGSAEEEEPEREKGEATEQEKEPDTVESSEAQAANAGSEPWAPKNEEATVHRSVEERKKAFFQGLYPIIKEENDRVRKEKAFLKGVERRLTYADSIPDSLRDRLRELGEKYRVPSENLPSPEGFGELRRKVDVIPPELALVQAANESNWGRSRFAKLGNNLFGEWCFSDGCGVVPKRRGEGGTHEVAAFKSVRYSVRSYIKNLNSHPAYKEMRLIRARMRLEGKRPSGYEMAGGLTKYSGIGHDYVRILRRMMRANTELLKELAPIPPYSFNEERSDERASLLSHSFRVGSTHR